MTMYIHPLSRERSRHGKLKIYVKEFALDGTGRKVLKQRHPMPDGLIEDTPPFVAAYQAICAKIAGGTAPAADRKAATAAPEAKVTDASDSLDWLIKTYLIKKGPSWTSAHTRWRVERSLMALRDQKTDAGLARGVCRYDGLTLEHMQDMQDTWVRDNGQGEARCRVSNIKALFNWAIKKRYVIANPCTGLELIKGFSKGKKKRGTVAWQEADAELWRRLFPLGSEARTLVELGYLGGLRRSDLGRVGPDNITGRGTPEWTMEWTEHKNRNRDPKEREQLLFNELREALIAREAEMPKEARQWLHLDRDTQDESTRNPIWVENLVARNFLEWRADAEKRSGRKLRHLTMHGLRAGGAVRLAKMGWTPHQIMGWGGWTNIKQVMKYTEDLQRQVVANDQVRAYNTQAKPRLRVVKGGR